MLNIPFPLHPVFVHFTVALSFTSFGAYVLAYLLPHGKLKNDLSVSAVWMLSFCFLASLLTIAFGFLEFNTVKHDMLVHMPMLDHRNWALATALALLGCTIFALRGYFKNKIHSAPLTVGFFVLVGMVGTTAYKGGELVYHYGLAVKSNTELRELKQNEQKQQQENIFQPNAEISK
ncbi:DUF2231 domain-containing protein [Candidatus Berkiella aquae]|uniref:DUF2231 domain-containing protein n=1 Tax=Candidatus Berkiella aquae TaxID=295108 RepID=A0A0Q9YF84_9GAMM|nr:DUF2231 domain-containing protein [Candidatus Berkiella aquae]MCS5712889.1 DUF2231 domain-containing protein [Candidatus Berkiella aquae]